MIEKEKLKTLNYEIKDLFFIGKKLLNSSIESELLIRNSLNLNKEEFYLNFNQSVNRKKYNEILKNFYLRKRGTPLSYITNKKFFLNYEFIVKKGVFIPRFETEEIVYHIIKNYNGFETGLDICCGTGVIGTTLLIENFVKKITFVDISKKTIENTKLNLKKFNIEKDRFEIIKSNFFKSINSKFDLIISNPPYIKTDEYKNLPKDVKNEPKKALLSGKDGLKHIRILLKESKNYLNKFGILVFEFNKDSLNEILDLIIGYRLKEIINTSSNDILGIVLQKM